VSAPELYTESRFYAREHGLRCTRNIGLPAARQVYSRSKCLITASPITGKVVRLAFRHWGGVVLEDVPVVKA